MGRVERDVDGEVPSAISAADTWRRRRDVRLWVFDRVDQRSTRPPPPIPIPTSSEIPAEKRLRYPKLYLQTVTEGLGESPCVHIIPFMTSTQPMGNSIPLRLTRNSISPPPPGPARSVKKRPSLHCEYCKLRAFYHRCLGTHPFPVRLHPYLAASLSWPPTLSRNHRGRQIPFTASKNSVKQLGPSDWSKDNNALQETSDERRGKIRARYRHLPSVQLKIKNRLGRQEKRIGYMLWRI
ncbi:hypothetical protein V8E55_008124 [Tylopilus felleus]